MAVSDYITGAFRNLMPLSALGDNAVFGMINDGKTIETVSAEDEDMFADYMDYGVGVEDDFYDMIDEDTVGQAKYQIENPDAVMNPWGPSLPPEAVDSIIDDVPGLEFILDMDVDEIDGLMDEADELLGVDDEFISSVWEEAEEIAMSGGEDPLDVATTLVDDLIGVAIDRAVPTGTLVDEAMGEGQPPAMQQPAMQPELLDDDVFGVGAEPVMELPPVVPSPVVPSPVLQPDVPVELEDELSLENELLDQELVELALEDELLNGDLDGVGAPPVMQPVSPDEILAEIEYEEGLSGVGALPVEEPALPLPEMGAGGFGGGPHYFPPENVPQIGAQGVGGPYDLPLDGISVEDGLGEGVDDDPLWEQVITNILERLPIEKAYAATDDPSTFTDTDGLNTLLDPDPDDDYGASPLEIAAELMNALEENVYTMEDITSWLATLPIGLSNTIGAGISWGTFGKTGVEMTDEIDPWTPEMDFDTDVPFGEISDDDPQVMQEAAKAAELLQTTGAGEQVVGPEEPFSTERLSGIVNAQMKAAEAADLEKQKAIDLKKLHEEGKTPGVIPAETTNNLLKVFYDEINKIPGANDFSVQSQIGNLFYESLPLFWMWEGDTAYQAGIKKDAPADNEDSAIEKVYRTFLSQKIGDKSGYLFTPQYYKSGAEFNKKVQEIRDVLKKGIPKMGVTNPSFWMQAMFGTDEDGNSTSNAMSNRRMIANLYVTGGSRGSYARRIHNTMDRYRRYWEDVEGKSPEDVFDMMTAPRGTGVVGPDPTIPAALQPKELPWEDEDYAMGGLDTEYKPVDDFSNVQPQLGLDELRRDGNAFSLFSQPQEIPVTTPVLPDPSMQTVWLTKDKKHGMSQRDYDAAVARGFDRDAWARSVGLDRLPAAI